MRGRVAGTGESWGHAGPQESRFPRQIDRKIKDRKMLPLNAGDLCIFLSLIFLSPGTNGG